MQQFFLEGGFGMFPTAVLGIASLGLACVYAARPRSRLFPLVVGTGAAALLAGGLGMLMGVKATVLGITGHTAMEAQRVQLVTLAGISESVNNLVLALALTTLVALVVGVGGYRATAAA